MSITDKVLAINGREMLPGRGMMTSREVFLSDRMNELFTLWVAVDNGDWIGIQTALDQLEFSTNRWFEIEDTYMEGK